jgi:tetratricopeptide (TPR) repeat protein
VSPMRIALLAVVVACLSLLASLPAVAGASSPPGPSQFAKLPDPSPPPPEVSASPGAATNPVKTAAAPAADTRVARATDATGPSSGMTVAEWVDLADEYAWQQDWTQTRRCLQVAVEAAAIRPDTGWALALGALSYAKAGDFTNAALLLATARNGHGNDAVAGLCDAVQAQIAADASRGEGDAALPVPALEQILADTARQWWGTYTGGWAALRLASYYLSLGDVPKATALCRVMERDYPGTPFAAEAVLYEGNAAEWAGKNPHGAIPLYQRALELTDSPRLRLRILATLADLYIEARDFGPALAVLANIDTEFAGRPGLPWAQYFRAKAERDLGKWDLAEADAQAYLATTTEEWGRRKGAHRIVGYHLLLRGQFTEAEAEFRIALEPPVESGAMAEALAGLARCRADQGDAKGAVEYYRQVATALEGGTEATQLAEYHFYLAMAAFEQQDFDTARAEYQRMLPPATRPDYLVVSARGAARCLKFKGDYAAAMAEFEALAATYPTFIDFCAEARYEVGDMLFLRGRYQEALVQFQRVLSEFPTSCMLPYAQFGITVTQAALATAAANRGTTEEGMAQAVPTPRSPLLAQAPLAASRAKPQRLALFDGVGRDLFGRPTYRGIRALL